MEWYVWVLLAIIVVLVIALVASGIFIWRVFEGLIKGFGR